MLDGIHYVLRPSFKVLYEIEQRLSAGIIALAQRFSEGQMTLQEMVLIIHCCMQHRASEAFIEKAIERNGLDNAMTALTSVFTVVFSGAEDEQ